jgi:hypothetical protein
LTRRAAGQAAVEPHVESTEAERARAALEPPEKVEDYKLFDYGGREIKLDAENEPIVRGEILPTAREMGLSQSDVEMATYAVMKPMTEQECEAHLHKVWGKDFDARHDDFRAAMAANQRARALVERYPDTLGNNAHLIVRVVEAYRRRQGQR